MRSPSQQIYSLQFKNQMHKQHSHSKLESLLLTETKERSFLDPLDPQYTSTPKQRRQLEFVSPYYREADKDLFSQLLGTDAKYKSPLTRSIEPVQFSPERDEDELSNVSDNIEVEDLPDSNSNENSNNMRKRKRKSNHQLKLLKVEFDRDEAGWNKDRIVRMAETTGLSVSQVYKWCWDQKKKTGPR